MTQLTSGRAEWQAYWPLPFVAALGYATSVIFVYALGPFIQPIQAEFGWSRAQISFGITIASFISALCCVPMGMLIDKLGPRKIGLVGVLLMAIAFGLLGTATGTKLNWIVLWCIVAFATLWVQATVWTSAVTSRFERSRGIALATTLSGASVSATIFPVLGTWLIEYFDWRLAFMILSGGWILIVFPLVCFFFRGKQDEHKTAPHRVHHHDSTASDGGDASDIVDTVAEKELPGLTLAEGFRSPVLYKLLVAGGCFAFTAIGIVVHFVPILTDHGADPKTAGGIASLIGIFSIIGRLGTGFLLDKFPGHLVGAFAFLIPIIACTLLLIDGGNHVNQSIAAAIFGLTLGSEVDVIAYLAARHFGLKNFGALYGALVMALSLGTAFGPLTAGFVFDSFGSYTPFLLLTSFLMGLSSVALWSLNRSKSSPQFHIH